MTVRNSIVLLTALLAIGAVELSAPPHVVAQPAPDPASSRIVLLHRGSWEGTFRTVGSRGRMLVYIDPEGNLYGSLRSDEGEGFAQISGQHQGNNFRMVFTPPLGRVTQEGSSTAEEIDGIARWQGLGRFVVTATVNGHVQEYVFER